MRRPAVPAVPDLRRRHAVLGAPGPVSARAHNWRWWAAVPAVAVLVAATLLAERALDADPAPVAAAPPAAALASWSPADLAPVPTAIPSPSGTRTAPPLDVCLVLDDSSSTTTSDPSDLRYRQARAAMTFLRQHPPAASGDRVCVVHFAGVAGGQLPLIPVADQTTIDAALTPARLADGTDISAALVETGRLLGGGSGRPPVVVLLSDGEDRDQSGIAQALAGLAPARVHLVALDAQGRFADRRAGWDAMGLSSIRTTGAGPAGDLELALGRVLVEELGLTWGQP